MNLMKHLFNLKWLWSMPWRVFRFWRRRVQGPLQPTDGDALASVTPELAKQAADRIKAAADIGDVMQVAVIANELKSENDALKPFL